MKANKVICTIETETLSPDSIPALVIEASELIRKETSDGILVKDDGDIVKWSTKTKKVEF